MTAPVVAVRGLTRRYRDVTALDGVDLDLAPNRITGLLGRNGAGKTTLMQILTGQDRATSGTVEVLGGHPFENEAVLGHVVFVKESQTYPAEYAVGHVLRAAALTYPNWDQALADDLVAAFGLPPRRRMKKLSRGMRSAVGVVVGLAARAPLTLFDEPYVGLDAVARQIFYDRLLADFAEHPRTILLSTHLIDEVGDLIERVVLLDRGRVVVDEEAEDLRGRASTVTGHVADVETFMRGRRRAHTERMGSYARVTVLGTLEAADRAQAEGLNLSLEPVSLQQFVVRTTTGAADAAPADVPEGIR